MAHLAGLYTMDELAPGDGELWTLLTRRFGEPLATASEGRLRVAVFAEHPGERAVAPHVEGAAGNVLGFGGDGTTAPERLVPPWLVCHYDPAEQTVIVRPDRHGFALAYVRQVGSRVAFCTSATALGRLPPAPEPDLSAWAEMLSFDQLLGDRTMRRGVTAIPQGHDLEISPGGIRFRRRFCYSDIELSAKGSARAAALSLVPLWRDAVARALGSRTEYPAVLVPLSGGLDSRLIAATAAEAGVQVESFTFAREPTEKDVVTDVVLAREVSRVLGIPWRFLPLEDDWLATYARRAAELACGQIDVVHSYAINATGAFTPGCLCLDGLAGDLVLGGSFLKKENLRAHTSEQCFDILWRMRARIRLPAWQELLRADARSEILERARASLSESLTPVLQGSAPGHDPRWSDFWALRNRVRRFTVNGSLLLRACYRPIFPFFVPGFIDRLLAVHPAIRNGAALQGVFLNEGWPRMAAIPWQKTGRSVPRGTLWDTLTQRLRRPAFAPRGAFYDFNAAFRRSDQLRAFIQDMLFDPRSGIARFGCFDRTAVERLVADTAAGTRAGMPQLGLLVSLVLSEDVWSSPA